MRLVTIYELGVRGGTYTENLDALHTRFEKLHKRGIVDEPPLRVATFGHTDIVEILLTNELFPFYAPPLGSTLTFRRPIGACIPTWVEALSSQNPPPLHRAYATRPDAVFAADGASPLVSVHYFKLSPFLKARAPIVTADADKDAPATLADQLAQRLTRPGNALWDRVREIEDALVPDRPDDLPPARITFLSGLDAMELVAIARCSRVEQVAAFVEAMRRTTLDSVDQGQELGGLSEAWRRSPLFANSTSLLGMQIERERRGWGLARHENPSATAASNARLLFRMRYPPGTRKVQRESLEAAARAICGETRTLSETVAFGLFGAFEVVPIEHGELRHQSLADGLAHVTGLEPRNTFPESLRGIGASATTVEVALREHGVEDADPHAPAEAQQSLWRHKARLLDPDDPESWVRLWLDKAHAQHLPYVAANNGQNLLTTVAGFLDGDLDGFLDVEAFVDDLVRGDPVSRRDTMQRLYELESLVASRVRREAPNHPPTAPLAFEAFAGYSTAHNAFVAYLGAISRYFGLTPPIVIEPFGAPPMLDDHGGSRHITSISPISIHHPIYWVHAHELGHFHEGVRACVAKHRASIKLGFPPRDGASSEAPLPEIPRPFEEGIINAMEETAADWMLWLATSRAGEERASTGRRFWFVAGPSLVYGVLQTHDTAALTSPMVLWAKCLRVALTSILTEATPEDFQGEIVAAFRWLRSLDDAPPPTTVGANLRDRVYALLDDLLEPGDTVSPRATVQRMKHPAPDVVDGFCKTLAVWAHSVVALQDVRAVDVDVEDAELRSLYLEYIDTLMDIPAMRRVASHPWLPHVDGHEVTDTPIAMSRRGGPFFSNDAEGKAVRRAYFTRTFTLLRRAEEIGRRRRYAFLSERLGSG